KEAKLAEQLAIPRSKLPAITHVDYSCRLQSVNRQNNPRFYAILEAFEKISGYAAVINTSFNVDGEPIVCTPRDAWYCFKKTDIDILIMDCFLIRRQNKPADSGQTDWEILLNGVQTS